jgi:hypothetical protein
MISTHDPPLQYVDTRRLPRLHVHDEICEAVLVSPADMTKLLLDPQYETSDDNQIRLYIGPKSKIFEPAERHESSGVILESRERPQRKM